MELIFHKWWPMGNGNIWCCWVLKSCDKFFFTTATAYGWWQKDNKKNCYAVPSPRSLLHIDKRQKEKNVSLSHLHEKILTKDNKKKIASLFHLHKKTASLSHLNAFVLMIHAHSPTLPFPCSCLRASTVTCLKLALTASGIFFKMMTDGLRWW